ncbi:MAG: hypothetical protein ABWY54_07465 [Glaciihabitans sp.]
MISIQGDNGFFAPVQYGPLWATIGLLVFALIIAWFIVVPLLTRPRPVISEATVRAALAPATRARYLDLITEVGAAHARSELTAREAHQRLSALVRAFVHESSGYPASSMTLTELRSLNLPGLTAAVERFYPAEFGTRGDLRVPESVLSAQRVVADWGQLP